MAKYKRGASLLGLTMADVDNLMGEPDDRMGRRLRFSSSNIPVPLPTVALYQRFIPLSEAYLRAESAEDLDDTDVLDDSKVTITPTNASPVNQVSRPDHAPQGEAVTYLLKTLADHDLMNEAAIRRVGEIVVMLGYLKMEPKEVFEAAMERKNKQAIEAFERASRAARGEG